MIERDAGRAHGDLLGFTTRNRQQQVGCEQTQQGEDRPLKPF
jgi:hypothetical protein